MAQNDVLSQEGLNQLAQVLEEAKTQANRQLELVEKDLKYEKDIGKTMIGYLNAYFSAYDKKLQQLATKQSSLSESFLVYQNQIDYFEAGNSEKGKKQPKKSASSGPSKGGGGKGGSNDKSSTGGSDDFSDNEVYNTRTSDV